MSVDVHPIIFLPIPPVQLLHPLLCHLQWNGSLFHTEAFLDLWPQNIIHNILGVDIPILGNLKKMELDLLGKVFIIKDWGRECAIVMEWEFLMMEITVDPGAYVPCMVWTLIPPGKPLAKCMRAQSSCTDWSHPPWQWCNLETPHRASCPSTWPWALHKLCGVLQSQDSSTYWVWHPTWFLSHHLVAEHHLGDPWPSAASLSSSEMQIDWLPHSLCISIHLHHLSHFQTLPLHGCSGSLLGHWIFWWSVSMVSFMNQMDRVLLTDVSSLWFDDPFCVVVHHELMKACFPPAAIALQLAWKWCWLLQEFPL